MIPPLPKTRYHIGVVVYVQYGGSSGNEMVIYSISCPIQSVVANLDFMHSLDIKIILSALYSSTYIFPVRGCQGRKQRCRLRI